MAVIELKNISFTYPDAVNPAIDHLSLNVEKGQFVVLIGSSGSGKSTLLRLLKKEIQPYGDLAGEIVIDHQNVNKNVELAKKVGFVFQDPENQVVADDVLHELVFGLENTGLPANEMRNRLAEMVHFFGAEPLLNRKTSELSGGKKQQIALASVLLMQPEILLLDEPTAQLDPVSTREFLDMLIRLNEEFGMTIILAEHRLEEIITLADKIVMLDNGRIIHEGEPRLVLAKLWNTAYQAYIPSIPSLFLKLKGKGTLPLTVREGRNWIKSFKVLPKQSGEIREIGEEILKAKGVSFSYDKNTELVLDDLNLTIKKGEFYTLLGGNGSGKSTLLKLLGGILKPQYGRILLQGKPLKSWKMSEIVTKIAYLPQNPKLFFIQDSLEKEIQYTMKQWGITDHHQVDNLLQRFEISHLMDRHPYDLSGGEIQKAALICLLLRGPEILLIDEPTKGLDPISKQNLASILMDLHQQGVTIVMSTHDIEFSSLYSSRCGMMFQGEITSEEIPEKFFNGNFFYTTMIQRLFRHVPDNRILTVEEAACLCKLIDS
jgi:energy-coupling factor transport system ATP-binding protein